jgi:hypothetical protein
MSEDNIKEQLLTLPAEIAKASEIVFDISIQKIDCEAKIELKKSAALLDAAGLPNDTARKNKAVEMLNADTAYKALLLEQRVLITNLEKARIEHQRLRDTFNALIAIAGIR